MIDTTGEFSDTRYVGSYAPSCEPVDASVGQIINVIDTLPDGRDRFVTQVFNGEDWSLVPHCGVDIGGFRLYLPHYRDMVYKKTGKFPYGQDSAAIIREFMWGVEFKTKTHAFVAHVADYNHTPHIVLRDAAGQVHFLRTFADESWGVLSHSQMKEMAHGA
tara:strand:- start:24058 stop:24540 length:483 start_codon:yes stop_codon:yes gene_type:complete